MRKILTYSILVLSFLTVFSCRKDQPSSTTGSALIRFVPYEQPAGTKGLITNDTDLKTACTGLSNQAIAVWAARKDNSTGVVTNDVFNGVYLRWQEISGPEGHEDNPSSSESTPSYWNTFNADGTSGPVAWSPGGTYIFRAYYPAGVELRENTNANLFISEYQSDRTQEDLMVAYTRIITNASNINDHVPLNLRHMLAAVSFSFSFKDGPASTGGFAGDDYLTSMWLENTSTGIFCDYGMLAFGDGHDGSNPTDQPEKIEWYNIYAPAAGVKMYEWVASGSGEELKNVESSTDNYTKDKIAMAYTPNGSSDTGHLFTQSPYGGRNYVLAIPQTLHGGTDICFKTSNGMDAVFRAQLPTTLSVGTGMDEHAFQAGYRYDIDLVITKLSIDVLITIKPWNVLDSSYIIEY